MKSINIVECKNEDDLKEVAILAEKIWHEFFGNPQLDRVD